MQHLHTVGTPRAHSNILCGCPHCKHFDYSATVIAPRRSAKSSADDTLPSRRLRPRPAIIMVEDDVDDCVRRFSVDTETLEHIIEYVAPDGTVVMTQTLSAEQWALHEAPFARCRRRK